MSILLSGVAVPAVVGLLHSGIGSPEDAIVAPVGHFYFRLDGGAGTTIYAKESGAGDTGWVALGAGGGSSMVLDGAGDPEGVVVATVGHVYLRNDGGAGTTLYVKESGAGDTGWVAYSAPPAAPSAHFTAFGIGTAGGGSVAAGATVYASFSIGFNATEANRQVVMPARTATTLLVRTGTAQPASGALTLTVRKNGAATALTITIAGGAAAGVFTVAAVVAFAAGDLYTFEAVNAAAAGSANVLGGAVEWE